MDRMLDRLDTLSRPEITVTDKAVGLARRFIAAYGEPDYELSRTSTLNYTWEHYGIEIYPDGHIMFQGDANWGMLLDNTGHMGRLARIGSAVREATGFGGYTRTHAGQAAADPARETACDG